jgi:hypothetical protein
MGAGKTLKQGISMCAYGPIRRNTPAGSSNGLSGVILSPSDKQALVSFFELLIEADRTERRKTESRKALKHENYPLEKE